MVPVWDALNSRSYALTLHGASHKVPEMSPPHLLRPCKVCRGRHASEQIISNLEEVRAEFAPAMLLLKPAERLESMNKYFTDSTRRTEA